MFVFAFFVLIVYGPQIASQLGTSIDQIVHTLQPYVLTVLGIIVAVLVLREFFRSRY